MGHSEKVRLWVVACEQAWYVMLSFQVHVEQVERWMRHLLKSGGCLEMVVVMLL